MKRQHKIDSLVEESVWTNEDESAAIEQQIVENIQIENILEEVKTLLEPEFAQKWPYADTVTVSVELDNLIEKVVDNIDINKLTVKGLFDTCVKRI